MTMTSAAKKELAQSLLGIAEAIEKGTFERKVKIGLTTLGSELGVENLIKGAELTLSSSEFEVILIGPKNHPKFKCFHAENEADMHCVMENLLDQKEIDACVTMHYNFPIGVSTVGRVITPGQGKSMFIATTTGTSAVNRVEAMLKNAIFGIIAAKSMGIEDPTVGVLNVDQARIVERGLRALNSNGYKINFGESERTDGGVLMRGNDLLTGAVDVMVTDTLTGNILMKMFSSFTTGGSYESMGYGYGPGIGWDYKRNILILSRASGSPVVANAIQYAAQLVKGQIGQISEQEMKRVKAAKFDEIVIELCKDSKGAKEAGTSETIVMPQKEVATSMISGIDIMDLEDAVKVLWKNGIYAESGMGCTGPIVLVNDERLENALVCLVAAGYIGENSCMC